MATAGLDCEAPPNFIRVRITHVTIADVSHETAHQE